MNRAILQQTLEFLEFCWRDVDMNDYAFERLESTIEALKQELENKSKPYAWRNPMNGVVIDDWKKHSMGIGNGYPNFSEPLYAAGVKP